MATGTKPTDPAPRPVKIALEQVLAELLPVGPSPQADERELIDLFKSLWPDQQQNLLSFRAKPDCQCKNQMMQRMAQTPELLHQLLDRLKATRGKTFFYSGDQPPPQPVTGGAVLSVDQSLPQPKVFHLAGQVRKIPNTPEAYLQLLAGLRQQGGRYTGLSVVKTDQELLVFFY